MANKLKAITTKAKALYKSGKFKKWTDAIKAASKSIGATAKPVKKAKKKKVSGYEGTIRTGKKTNVLYSRISGKIPSTYIKAVGFNGSYPVHREIVVGRIGKIGELKTLENYIPNVKVKISRGRKFDRQPIIQSITDAADILKKYISTTKLSTQEHAAVMYLDRQNRVIGVYLHTTGGIASTIIDVRLILAAALKLGALGLIVTHNHPSGNLQPSDADIKMTNELIKAAKYHDISVIDHIILTPKSFRSMRQNNDVKF